MLDELNVAIERALISAGAWWPGMRDEIRNNPEFKKETILLNAPKYIAAFIEAQRRDFPERFLPAEIWSRVEAIEDAALRYAEAVKEILNFRLVATKNLKTLRDNERD